MSLPKHSKIDTQNLHPLDRTASFLIGSLILASALRRGSGFSVWRSGLAAFLWKRAVSGHCEIYRAFGIRTSSSTAALPYETGIKVRAAITIKKTPEEVYDFWRDFINLSLFMDNILSVETIGERTFRWTVKGLKDSPLSWKAQLINDIRGELVAWTSLPGGDVDSAGSVRFRPAPGDAGTEIRVELQYNPPAGLVGGQIAKLLGRDAQTQIKEDLKRLKQHLEAGEIPTTEGQSRGPRSPFAAAAEVAS